MAPRRKQGVPAENPRRSQRNAGREAPAGEAPATAAPMASGGLVGHEGQGGAQPTAAAPPPFGAAAVALWVVWMVTRAGALALQAISLAYTAAVYHFRAPDHVAAAVVNAEVARRAQVADARLLHHMVRHADQLIARIYAAAVTGVVPRSLCEESSRFYLDLRELASEAGAIADLGENEDLRTAAVDGLAACERLNSALLDTREP